MLPSLTDFAPDAKNSFDFRPWVRRAGLSILVAAAAITLTLVGAILLTPSFRFGWVREPFVWIYIGTLWLGGAKVFTGTLKPVAEADKNGMVLRPLHQFFEKRVPWSSVRGTEQLTGGDRLIIYYETARGMRFVALNLNLVKGRKEFLALLDRKLMMLGFAEKFVERSRYLSRPA